MIKCIYLMIKCIFNDKMSSNYKLKLEWLDYLMGLPLSINE